MWDLAGSKGPKVKDGKSLPPNLYIGHFMKPYFKDRVTGVVSGWGLAFISEEKVRLHGKELSSPQPALGVVNCFRFFRRIIFDLLKTLSWVLGWKSRTFSWE